MQHNSKQELNKIYIFYIFGGFHVEIMYYGPRGNHVLRFTVPLYNGLVFRYNGIPISYHSLVYRYDGLLFCYNGLAFRYNSLLFRYYG